MKKRLALAVIIGILVMSPSAFAKNLAQGTIELSGKSDLSFLTNKWKVEDLEIKTNTFNIKLNPQYYVIDNLALGLGLGYNQVKVEEDGDTNTVSTIDVGPIIGYNISLADKFSIKPWTGIYYSSYTVKDEPKVGESDETKLSGYSWEIGLDGKMFIMEGFSVDAGLSYKMGKMKIDDTEAGDEDTVDVSAFNVGIGLSVYFK
jgi:hypothetical protein